MFTDTGSIQVEAGGYRHVDCATCRPAGHADPHFTLMEGYQWSLNVIFAELAVYTIKPDPLVQYARKFAFGTDYNANNPALGVAVATSPIGPPATPRESRRIAHCASALMSDARTVPVSIRSPLSIEGNTARWHS